HRARTEIYPLSLHDALPISNILRVGESIGSFWGYKRLGTWGTAEADEAAKFDRLPGDLKWADLNDDGILDARDETIIGNAYPKRSEEHTSELQSRENLVCRL